MHFQIKLQQTVFTTKRGDHEGWETPTCVLEENTGCPAPRSSQQFQDLPQLAENCLAWNLTFPRTGRFQELNERGV